MSALGRQWYRDDSGRYLSARRVLRGAEEVVLVDVAPAPMPDAPKPRPKPASVAATVVEPAIVIGCVLLVIGVAGVFASLVAGWNTAALALFGACAGRGAVVLLVEAGS